VIGECLAILAVGLGGGLLPLLTRWSYRGLHLALAASTGVFLGAVFLHMLPSLGAPHAHTHGAESGGGAAEDASMLVWGAVLVGVLAVYFVESLLFRTHDHDALHRHRAVGWASLVGLTLHAATTGFGLSAAFEEGLARPMFLAMIGHKLFEAFSLTSVYQLAEFPRRRILVLAAVFALVTPAGMLLGDLALHEIPHEALSVVLALAAGTFLYVCLCELLPEVFHHREDGLRKVMLLLVGIVGMAVLHRFEG